jgi:hypothetical protein
MNEGAKFWLSVLTELQHRGVGDILIACVDGLKGFPDAINAMFPQTHDLLSRACYLTELYGGFHVSFLRLDGLNHLLIPAA